MMNLGDFPTGATIDFKWQTNAVAGESVTRATNGNIRIYKANSTDERSSSNGITDTEDFDSLTGVHHCRIDLSDNTDAGFYAAGSEYQVVLQGATIDGKAVNAVLAHFSVERAGGILALLKDATFGLSALETLVDDLETRVGTPSDLGGGATIAANLSDIEAQTDDIGAAGAGLTAVPWNAAWDAEVQSEVADALGVYDAPTRAELTSDINSILAVLGALADAAADGDPTATDTLVAYMKQIVNVLVGSAGVVAFPASATPANGVSLAEVIRQTYDEVAGLNGASIPTPPTVGAIADAVWDETLADHLTAGSTGAGLNAASSAGDPWATALPGAYGAGSAGNILGNRLDTAVSGVAAAVWAVGSRTLTSFGTLVSDVATAVWGAATRVLTAGTNIVLAKGTGVTGFNDLSAAQVNAEVDTALADYDAPTSAELVSEINSVQSDIAALSIPTASAIAAAVRSGALATGVAADGAAPTLEQALFETLQILSERRIVGTTLEVLGVDGSTVIMAFTLDDAVNPTSQTRSS
jgi:hypothetical protein